MGKREYKTHPKQIHEQPGPHDESHSLNKQNQTIIFRMQTNHATINKQAKLQIS